jgi:hypothetical protein
VCDRRCLCPVARLEHAEEVRGVDADRVATDGQSVGDLLLRPARGGEAEELGLAIGQAEAARVLRRVVGARPATG